MVSCLGLTVELEFRWVLGEVHLEVSQVVQAQELRLLQSFRNAERPSKQSWARQDLTRVAARALSWDSTVFLAGFCGVCSLYVGSAACNWIQLSIWRMSLYFEAFSQVYSKGHKSEGFQVHGSQGSAFGVGTG